jgi:hypothetical protein
MAGRPRLYTHAHHFTLTVEEDTYAMLAIGMLAEYRKRHPAARVNDLVRSILEAAVTRYRASESERDGAAERERAARQKQLRRLGAQLAIASDDKLEAHARKLVTLVEAGPTEKTA